jgi:hypothetical protein
MNIFAGIRNGLVHNDKYTLSILEYDTFRVLREVDGWINGWDLWSFWIHEYLDLWKGSTLTRWRNGPWNSLG